MLGLGRRISGVSWGQNGYKYNGVEGPPGGEMRKTILWLTFLISDHVWPRVCAENFRLKCYLPCILSCYFFPHPNNAYFWPVNSVSLTGCLFRLAIISQYSIYALGLGFGVLMGQ